MVHYYPMRQLLHLIYRLRLKHALYRRNLGERLYEDDAGVLWQLCLPDDPYALHNHAKPAALPSLWETHAHLAVWADTSLSLYETAVAVADDYLERSVSTLIAAHRGAEGMERHCLFVALLITALHYGLALPPIIVNGSIIWDGYHRLIAWHMTNVLAIQVVDIGNFPDLIRILSAAKYADTKFRM